jgi:hypothetical protein
MKELKHSKFKNTGILFELLTRQITADIIEGTNSKATSILKRYFSKDKELYKEYVLYSTLLNEKVSSEHKSSILIETIINARKKLNRSTLQEEKFNLIKELKENFDIENFFKTSIPEYKVYASIYKLFEYSDDDNPLDIVRSKTTLMDSITKQAKPIDDDVEFELLENSYQNEPEDVRLLSYRILVNKFNEKYGFLGENQKNTLRHFILNISNSNNLKKFIVSEVSDIESYLLQNSNKIEDSVIKIKLNELLKLTSTLKEVKSVNDEVITKLLKLQELKNEIGRIL